MNWNKYFFVFIGLITTILISCSRKTNFENISDINKSVRKLEMRNNSDAFVIIEAVPSKKFFQLYKIDNVVYFQFPINSVSLKNISDIVRRGEVVSEEPVINGDLQINEFISSKELPDLQILLRQFDLNDKVVFENGYDLTEDKIVNYLTLIEGPLNIRDVELDSFSINFFTKVCKLSNFELNIIEN